MADISNFERKLNRPFFKYSKRFFDLLAINVIFIIVSVCSLMVLFFPGLVSLHTIAHNMIHDEDKSPYKTFFAEIKKQWMFMWRLELLCMAVILLIGAVVGFDVVYIDKVGYDWIVWFSLIFASIVGLVLLSIYLNLMIFNSYFKDDTFAMMIRKSALITLKKVFPSILNVLILASFMIVLWLLPYIAPFFSFSFYIYMIEAINRKSFTELSIEEAKRESMEENLFLPMTIEDEKENN